MILVSYYEILNFTKGKKHENLINVPAALKFVHNSSVWLVVNVVWVLKSVLMTSVAYHKKNTLEILVNIPITVENNNYFDYLASSKRHSGFQGRVYDASGV